MSVSELNGIEFDNETQFFAFLKVVQAQAYQFKTPTKMKFFKFVPGFTFSTYRFSYVRRKLFKARSNQWAMTLEENFE